MTAATVMENSNAKLEPTTLRTITINMTLKLYTPKGGPKSKFRH